VRVVKKLAEPYVIRPTSERLSFARGEFLQLARPPLLVNQWANVMRWELRTRPFHCAAGSL